MTWKRKQKNTELNAKLNSFSVSHHTISVSDIENIDQYLMKKHDVICNTDNKTKSLKCLELLVVLLSLLHINL